MTPTTQGTPTDNPMATDGFEFVEYTAPDPAALGRLFEAMGFRAVARHRSKNVTLYRLGDVNFIVNAEPDSFAQAFARVHGPSICAIALRVGDAAFDEPAKTRWAQHWIAGGFDAIETMLGRDPATGTYCHGERPTVADAFLIPQVANARRFALDLAPCPTIVRIDAACRALAPLAAAAPERQPDAA